MRRKPRGDVQRGHDLRIAGRFDDAIRVLSDAVTGVKAQSKVLPSRRRSLAILYQQLGMLYRDTQISRPRSTPSRNSAVWVTKKTAALAC